MPAYYFDISDGSAMVTDEDGRELVDRKTVRPEAVPAIAENARDRMRASNRLGHMTVPNASGQNVMFLSLALTISDVRNDHSAL